MNNRIIGYGMQLIGVPIKVEQLNENLFLNPCVVRTNRKLHNEVKISR